MVAGHVFISHASEDAAVATQIRTGLEQAGLRCWIAPRDIEVGTSFPAAITAAATSCGALLLLLTEASNGSPHVLSEVRLAFNARKPILAVLVGRVTPSPDLEYFISTTHWFDAQAAFDDQDLTRLLADLRKLLAGEALRLERTERRQQLSRGVMAAVGVAVLAIGAYWFIKPGFAPSRVEPPAATNPPPVVTATVPAPGPDVEPPMPLPAPVAQAVAPEPAPATAASAPRSPAPAATGANPVGRARVNKADGQTYMWIPPGRFTMGCSAGDGDCEPDEMPAHAVRIRTGFWLARTEVTAAQYAKHAPPGMPAGSGSGQEPVTDVDRAAAKAYCAAIGGRVPTEAEWEYAARAGTTERHYDAPLADLAWFEANSDDHAHPVGLKTPNAFGLHDMLGNVYEWVLDRYYNKYDDTDDTVEEPTVPNAYATARGGAWTSRARDLRVSNRFGGPLDMADANIGFRCALSGS
jgi:formylglycine-generating enzyme required for sulfatase activity